MTDTDHIKYRADGSIDIEHYTQIGRRLRSEQALGMLTGDPTLSRRPRRRRFSLFAAL